MSVTKILLLGSTGSIGKSACNCIRRFKDRFVITGLGAGKNIGLLCEQIDEFRPESVYSSSAQNSEILKQKYGSAIKHYRGSSGLEELVQEGDYDILLNALVGAVGLRSTVAALRRGKKVALANKESLVVGGDLIRKILHEGNGTLLPVDSEHSAILQCLSGAMDNTIESLILTASGGPFRNFSRDQFATITPEAALNHPTWSMGKKITIDSATLMNKGFEVIEAHYLFSLPYSKLKVWVHPQSIVHSLVEFHDGAVMAQLGMPDMELPIQYALTYPQRLPIASKRLSLPEVGRLDFFEPDLEKFPCLRLCIEAGELGGTATAVINAANEVAVELFLQGKIAFNKIPAIVEQALRSHKVVPVDSIETIEAADTFTREQITKDFS